MPVLELYLEDALSFVKEKGTKLVWIGKEPTEYISQLLDLEPGVLVNADPNKLLHIEQKDAAAYKDHIFVCYHGVSSKYVAEMLDEEYKLESGSLKGGVTAIVGEIF